MACDPRRIGEFQDNVGLALDYAEELGVPQLHCLAGKLHAAVSVERAHQTYVANLRFAAAQCQQRSIKLLIEPLNSVDAPATS
jgi:hydroxypyruvate isomerase